jgi:hypothetical protein
LRAISYGHRHLCGIASVLLRHTGFDAGAKITCLKEGLLGAHSLYFQ